MILAGLQCPVSAVPQRMLVVHVVIVNTHCVLSSGCGLWEVLRLASLGLHALIHFIITEALLRPQVHFIDKVPSCRVPFRLLGHTDPPPNFSFNFVYMCVSLGGYVHVHVLQEVLLKGLGSLAAMLQVVRNCLMRALEAELSSSGGA